MRIRIALLCFAAAAVAVTAQAAEDAGADDQVFWSDPRGIILPMGEGELDMVRLGQLREQYERGMAHLEAGAWAEAAEDLEAVAAELPVPEVLLGTAMAHFQLEHYGRAEQLLSLAVGDAPADVRVANLLGLALSAQGRAGEAVPELERCMNLAEATGNRAFEAYAMLNLAQAQLDLGAPRRAAELAADALEIGRGRRYGNVIAAAQNALGNVALYRGDSREAERYYRKSMQVERRGRGNDDRAAVLNNLANVRAARGDLAEARDLLEEAVSVAREAGRRTQQGGILVTLAGLEQQLGATPTAEACLAEALDIFEELDLDRGIVEVRLQQARVARAGHHTSAALDLLEMARVGSRTLTLPQLSAEMDLLEAELLLDVGDFPAAALAAERAASWFEATEQARRGARARLAWAEAREAIGDESAADEGYGRALEVLEGGDDQALISDARQRYGLCLLRRGEVERGAPLLAGSLSWMERQGRYDMMAQALNLAGAAYAEIGDLDSALESFEAAGGAAALAGRDDLLTLARTNQLSVLSRLGRWDEAADLAGPDADAAVLGVIQLGRASVLFDEGLAAMDAEQWDRAVDRLQAVLVAAPGDDRTLRVPAHANLRMIEHHLGLACMDAGDLPGAADHLERALEHVSHEQNAASEARLLKDLALLRFELGDVDRAARLMEQAQTAASASGDDEVVRTTTFHTGLVLMESEPEIARTSLAQVISAHPDAADELAAAAHYNLGILLFRAGEIEASRQALIDARTLYEQHGRADQVDQIDGYLEDFPVPEAP